MPMTPVGEYLYFLMVTLLYGSPIIAIVLFLGWRRRRLGAAIKGVAVLVPVAALALQLLLRGSLLVALFGLERESRTVAEYLGDPARADVIQGSYIGNVGRFGADYRRYQFPSLDASTDHFLEILVPPNYGGMPGYIRLSDDAEPAQAPARMLVWPERIGTNPSMDSEEFFREHYPGERPDAFGPHTLIVGLRPRQSIVVLPSGTDGKWRWTNAELDLSPP